MLIAKEVEAKIVEKFSAALSTAGVTDVNVAGAWQTAQSGLVKWIESPDKAAYLSVSVGTPGWRAYSTPVLDLSVNATIFVRPEMDPQGTVLAAVADAVESKLKAWETSTYQAPFTDLDINGFSVDGIAINAGASPTVANGIASVTYSFTLTGAIAESVNTNN